MTQTNLALAFGILIFLSISCSQTSDFELEKQRILELHHAQRDYHFEKDSIRFANQLSDDFISVNRGKITYPDSEETISRYNSYFSSVQFIKWDDLAKPIIRFSEDGTMAYTIVDKIVTVEYENENGETEVGETHFSWTAIYKKHADEWKIDCVTSTEEPSN
ncbi:MAG: nuclear transport factor 2 family protein [Cyclobacteriaceae bacterium]